MRIASTAGSGDAAEGDGDDYFTEPGPADREADTDAEAAAGAAGAGPPRRDDVFAALNFLLDPASAAIDEDQLGNDLWDVMADDFVASNKIDELEALAVQDDIVFPCKTHPRD
jgi:hypothetical protein